MYSHFTKIVYILNFPLTSLEQFLSYLNDVSWAIVLVYFFFLIVERRIMLIKFCGHQKSDNQANTIFSVVVWVLSRNRNDWLYLHYLFLYSSLSYLLLFSCSVVSDSLQPHGLQQASLPCLSPSPGVGSNSCPLSQWWHPTISFYLSLYPSLSLSQYIRNLSQGIGSHVYRGWEVWQSAVSKLGGQEKWGCQCHTKGLKPKRSRFFSLSLRAEKDQYLSSKIGRES